MQELLEYESSFTKKCTIISILCNFQMICSVRYCYFNSLLSFFLILRAIVSTAKLNSNADTGQPCFIPRDILNDSDRYPLFLTFAEQPEYNVSIHLIKFSPKLNFKFYKNIRARQSRMLFRNQEIEVTLLCLICVCLHIKLYLVQV